MKKIAPEVWIIAAIGLADLVTTLYLIYNLGAEEANPIFAKCLKISPLCFSAVKIVMLAGPLFILEWARRRSPAFTRFGLRFAIAAYIGMYGVGVYRINSPIINYEYQRISGMDMASNAVYIPGTGSRMHREHFKHPMSSAPTTQPDTDTEF